MHASKYLHLGWLSLGEIHKGTEEVWLRFRKKLVFKMCFKLYKWRHLLKIAELAKTDIAKNYKVGFGKFSEETWNLLHYRVPGKIVCNNIEFLLVEKLKKISGGNAKKISMPKLKPRYLCGDTSDFIESTFKWKLNKYSFLSPNNFWFRWILLELLAFE